MLSSRKSSDGLSLRTLRCRVSLNGLHHLEPILLLQILMRMTQALNGSAAHAEVVARALILDGQRRLSGLRNAAPNLSFSLDHLLKLADSREPEGDDLSTEEGAVQALLEVCLGLMLRWLSKRRRQSHLSTSLGPSRFAFSFDAPFPLTSFPLILAPRARACPISPV